MRDCFNDYSLLAGGRKQAEGKLHEFRHHVQHIDAQNCRQAGVPSTASTIVTATLAVALTAQAALFLRLLLLCATQLLFLSRGLAVHQHSAGVWVIEALKEGHDLWSL